jgi:aspartyl-tRNA(Asn)/glutamyl-tRNA(Gln) amidotransferase subunit B
VTDYEAVIGLESHVLLSTRTKMFCGCELSFGEPPNTHTCEVCLALPGALPVVNEKAIHYGLLIGLALGCELAPRSIFHRKNYFYPDSPKGYQISQYDEPLCRGGRLGDIRIHRVHLEEDAAKLVHTGTSGRIHGADTSVVDFNRCGTPLVEIVTQPDLRSADDAKRFLQLLRQTIVELGISDAEMEKGTLRADANVSVRKAGEDGFRTRTELKNMNSFNFIARGIDAEVARQVEVWDSGGEVIQQTYDFHAATGTLSPRRQKEEADDYRYFPEPDLVPIAPEPVLVERIRGEIPEHPGSRIRRLAEQLGLDSAQVLVTGGLDDLWRRVVAEGADPVESAKVLANQFVAAGVDPSAVNAEGLARLIEARRSIPRAVFVEALAASGDPGFSAERYLGEAAVTDTSELEPLIERVLAANPDQVETYRGGKEGVLGFFVGQVMKETQGKADAKVVSDLVRAKLKG